MFKSLLYLFILLPSLFLAQIDILNGQDWSHFSGAIFNSNDNRLKIIPLSRKIRPKTSGTWYNNPAINLRGPYLQLSSSEFSVEITLDNSAFPQKFAFVDIYGKVPIVYDEWILSGNVLRVGIKGGRLTAIVNNLDEYSANWPLVTYPAVIKITQQGSTIYLALNGKSALQIPKSNVFSSKKLFFGAEAELGGGFTITKIIGSGQIKVMRNDVLGRVKTSGESLRSLVDELNPKKFVGTAAHFNPLMTDDRYRNVLAREFNMITTELDLKPQNVQPLPGVFAFAEGDALIEFAQNNQIKVRGHCLVWHEALPQWMWDIVKTTKNKADLRARMIKVMEDHITAVVSHYKGKIKEWDVVNEIFSDNQLDYDAEEGVFGLRNQNPELDDDGQEGNNPSIWYTAIGPEYVEIAFKKAHEIDPEAKLF